MKKIILFLFICGSFLLAKAQEPNNFAAVDAHAKQMGALKELNVARIADTLTRPFANDKQKLRALFYWMAHQISLDVKAARNSDNRPVLPETVIAKRVSSAQGFATLFQEMSSRANIRCLVVDGFIKRNFDDLENIPDEVNHSWNVVQLGKSSDTWFYVDVAAAAGSLQNNLKEFRAYYTENLFFADKELFNLTHYPNNDAWQLGPGPKSMKSFYHLPVIETAAFEWNLANPIPNSGLTKTSVKKGIAFSFILNATQPIEKVELIIGESRKPIPAKPMNFTYNGNLLSFNYKFDEADTYPVQVLVNGKTLLRYMIEVKE